jgi:hypothetical protein
MASIPYAAAGVLAPEPLPTATSPVFQSEPLLSQSQLRRLGGYSSAGEKLLEERLVAARERLERAPDEHFGIELFVTDNPDPARMERFLVRARDMVPLGELLVIPVERGGRYRLRVVLGEFADREQAQAAERRLPPKYQHAFRSAPRSFAELREQI